MPNHCYYDSAVPPQPQVVDFETQFNWEVSKITFNVDVDNTTQLDSKVCNHTTYVNENLPTKSMLTVAVGAFDM
jgi:hypothetical protein